MNMTYHINNMGRAGARKLKHDSNELSLLISLHIITWYALA